MDREALEKRKAELTQELERGKALVYRIEGALVLIEEMLTEPKE